MLEVIGVLKRDACTILAAAGDVHSFGVNIDVKPSENPEQFAAFLALSKRHMCNKAVH